MHDAAARYKIHIDEEFTDEDDFDAAENLLERFISSENTAIVTQGGPLFLNNLVAATRQRGMKIPQDSFADFSGNIYRFHRQASEDR